MGPVEAAIRARFPAPERLLTPIDKKAYELARVDEKGIHLKLQSRGDPLLVRWSTLEGIPAFLEGRGFIHAAGMYVEGAPPTLDEYLKPHVTENVGRWVALILSEAEIVLLKRGKPIRLALAQPD